MPWNTRSPLPLMLLAMVRLALLRKKVSVPEAPIVTALLFPRVPALLPAPT